MEQMHLLYVEDEIILSANTKRILEYENYKVSQAFNGKDALELLGMQDFDLIICDVMMPEMNGIEFYKNFLQFNRSNTPFIFLTANAHHDDVRQAMNLGVDDYLIKPVKSLDLLKAIEIRLAKKLKVQESINSRIAKYSEEIAKRDDCLRDIAQNQSHVIRAPLATLMAIISLIDTEGMDEQNKILIEKLAPLADKLDNVIRENVYHINQVERGEWA